MKYPTKQSYATEATTDKPGLIRIATQAVADAGIVNDQAITPKTLGQAAQATIPNASTAEAGKVELATDTEAQAKTNATKAITPQNLASLGFLQWTDTVLTSSQVKNLRATPIQVVAPQLVFLAPLFVGALIKLTYGGTNAFTESADNLVIRFTDGTGTIVSQTIESTGFIDATENTYASVAPAANFIVAGSGIEGQPLVLHNSGDGEIGGNAADDNTLSIRAYYLVQSNVL